MSISLLTAFLGGTLSFLSPCLLPILPGYFGYITGISLTQNTLETKKRIRLILHAIAFSIGFAIVLITLGAAIGLLSQYIEKHQRLLSQIGGGILILLGIHMTGIFSFEQLLSEKKFQTPENKNHSLLGSLATGLIFGFGWSPCYGPILGSIATIAAVEADFAKGIMLFIFYAIGFTIPLIILTFFASSFVAILRKLSKIARYSSLIAGIIIIFLGLLMVTQIYQKSFDGWGMDPTIIEEKVLQNTSTN